jgi:CAAX protease family protein
VRGSTRDTLDPTAAVAIAVGVLAVRSAVGESLVPPVLYVPVNLATAALLALVSWSAGLSASELGLSRAAAPRGVVVGVAVAVIVVAGIAVGAALPATRPLFEDQRIADVHRAVELAYQALARIPLGTALVEEFAFRGALLGLLARVGPMRTAVAVSSLLFGLWHIRPTLGALAANDLAEGVWSQVGAVTAGVGEPRRSGDRARGRKQCCDRRRLCRAARRLSGQRHHGVPALVDRRRRVGVAAAQATRIRPVRLPAECRGDIRSQPACAVCSFAVVHVSALRRFLRPRPDQGSRGPHDVHL